VARARLTRSELKAQDEITTTIQSFGEIAVARKNELVVAGAVLVVLVAGIVGWRFYSSGQDTAAQKSLGAVISAYRDPAAKSDHDRFEKTINEADKVVKGHGSSQAGLMAQYYRGLAKDGLGDTPNAVKDLEEVIGRADAGFKPIAQFALAGVYKRHGEAQKAIDVLKQLEQSGGYSKSAVAFEIGAAAEGANQKEVAQTYYSKVITESSDSPMRGEAEVALKRMGLAVPTPPPQQITIPSKK